MKRRLALGGMAAAAAAAGAGFAWWRSRRSEDPVVGLWATTFSTPDGASLAMGTLAGKPLLLNFWATWCPPCVTEMPLLDGFARAHPQWSVLALAVDMAEPVRRFTRERKLQLPVALAHDVGPDLARRLGNSAGGLPFSLAFDVSGAVVQRKLGALDETLLRNWSETVR